MATEANKDAAEQSLDIAKSALATGNLDKAQKFAEKAMKLYPSDEVSRTANAPSCPCSCSLSLYTIAHSALPFSLCTVCSNHLCCVVDFVCAVLQIL